MKIFETYNFDLIQEICAKAKNDSQMSLIIGYPGAGKSVGLKYFKKFNKRVYYVCVRKSMTMKEFYIELLKNFDFEGDFKKMSLFDIINILTYKIKITNKKNLLIIDEAGKFKPNQLEYIHEIRDLTKEIMGIVLSGPGYFLDNLIKWKEKNITGIPEVYRRIEHFETLKKPTIREIRAISYGYKIMDTEVINKEFRNIESFSDLTIRINNYLAGD